MKAIYIEGFVAIVIAGYVGLNYWQNHQRDINSRVNYDGEDVAISRPVKLSDTAYKICQTKRVADGDTIEVDCDGEELKLRFCGIDAPESKQPLGQESKALMAKLVEGKQVMVYPIEKDRYDRTIAEVEVFSGQKTDKGENVNLFVNGEMVLSGLAYHYAQYSSSCPNKEAIVNAEDLAKDKKLGVWSGDYQKPWDYRKQLRSLSNG